MKKLYYAITIILSVLATVLFVILAMASLKEVSTAITSILIAGISAGFMTVSILGLKNNSVIRGVVLEKIGVLLIGFGALVLSVGLYKTVYLLQAILIAVPVCGIGAFCFKIGMNVIKKSGEKAGALIQNEEWNTYIENLCSKMPFLRETLRAGASMDDIKAAEAEIGVQFPEKLRGLYLANDGDNGEAVCGMMLGFHFLSLDILRMEWRRSYAKTRWVPIGSDGGGNFIGVDLEPGGNGQVINFGRDEQGRTVLAENLGAFFERFTRIVCSDDFYIGEYDDEKVILLGTDNIEEGAYLTDYLKSADSVK